MDSENLPTKVRLPELTDLELAILVCLVAEQHCIIRVAAERLDAVEQELCIIANKTFGLRFGSLGCGTRTSGDEFDAGVFERASDSNGTLSETPNIFVAKRINFAPRDVQVMALELIRNKRIMTSSGIHSTSSPFVLIMLITDSISGPPYLTPHLNDAIFISHTIASDTPLPYTTAASPLPSSSSIPHFPSPPPSASSGLRPKITAETLARLKKEAELVRTTAEIRRYIHNIPTFLRLHRAVAGGVSALATRHLNSLVRLLAPLHEQTYVTPSLISIAAYKIYSHRVVITTPENERSMQWGSDFEAVTEALEEVTVERIIQEILDTVAAPL